MFFGKWFTGFCCVQVTSMQAYSTKLIAHVPISMEDMGGSLDKDAPCRVLKPGDVNVEAAGQMPSTTLAVVV